jgi:hypothetical protein
MVFPPAVVEASIVARPPAPQKAWFAISIVGDDIFAAPGMMTQS